MNKVNINSKTGSITINDFSIMDLNSKGTDNKFKCTGIYNFNNQQTLQAGVGIQELKVYMAQDVNSQVKILNYASLGLEYINKVMYFKQYFSSTGKTSHRLLVHGSDGNLYLYQMYVNANMLNWTYRLNFETIPIVLEYKHNGLDSILISANDKLIVWSTGLSPYELTNVPTITSMCIHNEVLYCTIAGENDNIWYTKSINPEEIGGENSKYISIKDEHGSCRRIINFKNNVYIFRDYGIAKLNTYVRDDPTYNQTYISNTKILPNTVVDCGEFIMFATYDGIYKFDGADVKVMVDFPSGFISFGNNNAVATVLQGKYYVALNINFDDSNVIGCESYDDVKNNALLKIDTASKVYEILRGVDIKDMLALKTDIEEKVILTFNSQYKDKIGEITNNGKVFDDILPKAYTTNYVAQDDLSGITIRRILVDAKQGIDIKVTTDNGQQLLHTYNNGINEFQTIIPCHKLKIDVYTLIEQPYINLIQLEYEKR